MVFLFQKWFWRGAQSALFYYASCPLSKTPSPSGKEKAENKASQSQDGVYKSRPGTQNPGWNEEIMLGPGPPTRRIGKKEMRKRDKIRRKIAESLDLDASRPGNSRGPVFKSHSSTSRPSTKDTNTTNSRPANPTKRSSDVTNGRTNANKSKSKTIPSKNATSKKRFSILRRRSKVKNKPIAEALNHRDFSWNNWKNCAKFEYYEEPLFHLKGKGFSLLSTEPDDSAYYYARNPEVNDLHPPVVSAMPRSRAECAWMFEPPPSAAIMMGREPENRRKTDMEEAFRK